MSTHSTLVRLVYLMLTLACSASAAFSPPRNPIRDVHGPRLAQREICQPCGMYCCGELEYCHQDILWNELSDPYCRLFKIGGTKTSRTRSSHSQTTIPYTNIPTMTTITSALSTRDKNFDDFPKPTATDIVHISVTTKIEGLPTDTNPGNTASPLTDIPSPTTTSTGTGVGNGFAAGTATVRPNDGRVNRALGMKGAWLVAMVLVLSGFFGI